MSEEKAWQELSLTLKAIPANDLCDFFHGSVEERDQVCDRAGIARESWWLLGVLRITPD